MGDPKAATTQGMAALSATLPNAVERHARTPASFARSVSWHKGCRHFARLDSELGDLRERLQADPEGTQRELMQSGAWRYYSEHVGQAKRLQSQLRREGERLSPKL